MRDAQYVYETRNGITLGHRIGSRRAWPRLWDGGQVACSRNFDPPVEGRCNRCGGTNAGEKCPYWPT